jgi:hypothetical protein
MTDSPHLVRRILARLTASVIKPVPPELDACEFCGRLECGDTEWKSCERRLAAAEFIRKGDDAALARLKRAHEKVPDDGRPLAERRRTLGASRRFRSADSVSKLQSR